ncbi:M14 family metallopeptidase [Acidaminococcus sp.]|uniref:M14 family metallopeptidase n=1 Tax=Acidaminococcus sp. TaxID=1872103 RepID=UPI003AB89C09
MKAFPLDLKKGEKKVVPIPVPDGPTLEAVYFCGEKAGRTLVAISGVHGCEYVGIRALQRLMGELDPKKMTGNVVILPLANPSGFYAGAKQVVPEDGKNLNRAFPGTLEGSLSSRMAQIIEETLYPMADLLVDLHSGDVNEALHPLVFFPAAGSPRTNEAALAAAKCLTVPYRVSSSAQNGLYSWAVQKGIPALLIERGGLGQWTDEEVAAACEDVRSLLRHEGILPGSNPPRQQAELTEVRYIEAKKQGFWVPAVTAGETVKKGEPLGSLQDLWGNPFETVRADFSGVALYLAVSLGVRKGDVLIAYGGRDEK